MIAVIAGLALVAASVVMMRQLGSRLLIVGVAGGSMEPLLRNGDRVLIWRGRRLKRGCIVALHTRGLPTELPPGYPPMLIKKLIAVAGDPIPGRADLVPPGHVYVLGTTERSLDSRVFGCIPRDLVAGRATVRLP